jgi:Cys/Met metabolism PLP-dependent enzyme
LTRHDISLDPLPGEIKHFVLFLLAESLGGVESLVCYPVKMTHIMFGKSLIIPQETHPFIPRADAGGGVE